MTVNNVLSQQEQAERQQYLYNFPEGHIYLVEYYANVDGVGKWSPYYWTLSSQIMTYNQALDLFNQAETSTRICKLSRYLVEGRLVTTSIEKIKIIPT